MSVVIDASVALKWVLPERGTEAALALRREELIAPAIWFAEAANALWRHVRLGEIAPIEAQSRVGELLNAPIGAIAVEPYIEPGLRLATQLDHPVYDCLYLAVALDRNTHVITDDRRFAAAAARAGLESRVRLLGEVPPTPPSRTRRRRGGPSH